MQTLNLPMVDLRVREMKEKVEVFDIIRKKFVALTPEEWVRQHFLHYLKDHRGVPVSLMVVEATLNYYRLKKRCDIAVYGKNGIPCLIVECKAPEVKLTQAVFDQIALYNMKLKVPYLAVTNGMVHFACHIDHGTGKIVFLNEIPLFEQMVKDGNT